MPYKSEWTIPIPSCSLPTFLFGEPGSPLPEPGKRYVSDAERPDTHFFTRQQFKLWCLRFAQGLSQSKHWNKGDRVLLFSNNNLFSAVVFVGTLCAGGIFSGANPLFTPRELAHQLRDSEATYLICADSALDTGIKAAKEAGMSKDRIFIFNDSIYDGADTSGTQARDGCPYWGDLLASEEASKDFKWNNLSGPGESDTTLALNYSSGTTGVPKGVEVTHKNYISNTLQVAHIGQQHPDYANRMVRARWLGYLPMYHAYGQTYLIANAFHNKIPVYLMTKFDFIKALGFIQKFRITDLTLVPPVAVALAKHPAVEQYDLSSVEVMGCGAAPLGRDISSQLEQRLGGRVNMHQGWGMTEVTCSALGCDVNTWYTTATVGGPNANCTAKIMSVDSPESGFTEVTERGPQHTGELWIQGLNVMKGYWRNPTATANTLVFDSTDGEKGGKWLRTGDVAYVDDAGNFYIVDRIKELIKVKGNQVAPAELEALLLEHPAVADAAVIGMPTEDGDEMPRAFVVTQSNVQGKVTERELQDFVVGKVVRYKRLTGGVEFVNEIPKNPSGKILRRQLRDRAKLAQQPKRSGERAKL